MELDTFSCIKTVVKTVHITLPPLYVTNEMAGVTDTLESWKRQYVPQVEGVVVSYKNVSLLSNTGYIVIDKPVIHYDVKATFEIFCPSVGSIVKGKINRISNDYIGCLIHNTINVTIKRTLQECNWLANIVAPDNMVLFEITFFDFHRRVVRIKGEITEECIKLMKEIPLFSTQTPTAVFENSQSIFYSSEEESSVSKIKNESPITEDNNIQSPSLLAPKVTFIKKAPSAFNVDHLAATQTLSEPTTSHNSDSSLSETDTSTNRNQTVSKTAIFDSDLSTKIHPNSVLEQSPKHKKKKKDKSKSTKSSKTLLNKTVDKKHKKDRKVTNVFDNMSNLSPKSVKKKKSTKKTKLLKSDLLNNRKIKVKSDSPKKKSSKKKNKKVENVSASTASISPKQENNNESRNVLSHNTILNDSIKDELKTDSSPLPIKPKEKKSKISTKVEMPNKDDLESMINALAAFEPSSDSQLSFADGSLKIKDEPFVESPASNRKRKHESKTDENSPMKKTKKSDKNLNDSKKKKNKAKKKEKSKKEKKNNDTSKSKKDKKKKLKDQSTKSKNKIDGNKGKDKKKKSKKSSKDAKKNSAP